MKRHIILFNPADNVEKLATELKQVEILTIAEFRELAKPEAEAPQQGAALPPPPLEVQAEFGHFRMSLHI